jgi:hypothetical protein
MVQCNGYDLVHDENVDKNYSKNASLDKESNRESCRRQLLKRLLTRSKGWCSCTRTIALGNTHPPSAFEEQLAYKRGITSSYENCESRRGFARHKYSILRPRSVPQQTRLHDHFRLTVRSEQPSDKTLGWQRPRQSPHLHTGYPTGGTNPRTHRTHSLRAALPGPVRRIESLYIYIYIFVAEFRAVAARSDTDHTGCWPHNRAAHQLDAVVATLLTCAIAALCGAVGAQSDFNWLPCGSGLRTR